MEFDLLQALVAGLVATVAMTIMMYGAPVMGMPRMDIATMLGSMTGVLRGPAAFGVGMVMHFLNGTVIFPLIFAAAAQGLAEDLTVVWGLAWGALLFVLANAVMMPMLGLVHAEVKAGRMSAPGFLALNWGMLVPLGSLLGHLLYGLVLGGLYVS